LGFLEARGLWWGLWAKDLNEALIFGVAFVFLFPFFDAEVERWWHLRCRKSLTTLDGTTREDGEKNHFNSILVLIICGRASYYYIRFGAGGKKYGLGFFWDIMDLADQELDSVK